VPEAETLGELACAGERLQAELALPSSGVGQIEAGQPVKLLHDIFPSQLVGVRHGAVRWVSPTVVGDQFRVFADITDAAITVKGEARGSRRTRSRPSVSSGRVSPTRRRATPGQRDSTRRVRP
jgi:hypothetical protein